MEPPRDTPSSARTAGVVAAVAALSGVFLALRLPRIGSIPNASHDEGNWLLVAWQIATGHPPTLSSDASFVTTLFARMLSPIWRITPMTVGSARAALVFWQLALSLGVVALAARMRLLRAGLCMFALLAVHPWSVLWSRSVTVPYALSLVLAVLAPLAFLHAWHGAPRHPRLARVAAGQAFALGFHFTPLAALPAASALFWSLASREGRRALRAPGTLASIALALGHVAPIGLSALGVARRGSTRPSHYFTWFSVRLKIYARTMFEGLTGEATLRDYTGNNVSAGLSWLLIACAFGLMACALMLDEGARGDEVPRPRRLATFGAAQLATAFVGLALMLAPMRQWHLQVIDAERYLFVSIAPFVLMLGALAEQRHPRAWLAPLAALWLLASPTLRAGHELVWGGGPDRGLLTQYGGGAERRWKTTRDGSTLPQIIFDEAMRATADGAPVAIVTGDYRHHPLWFYRVQHPARAVFLEDSPSVEVRAHPGVVHLFVRWSDGLFAPGFRPTEDLRANERVDALMRSEAFVGLTRVRTVVQPNGAPLIELWRATRVP